MLSSWLYRIKKAYRKKALELHPDRNYGNVEAATKQFADVQSAYELLSDPQERAWYDTHRDSILRDDDDGDHFEHNTRVTTAEDILRLFSRFNSQIDFSDSPTGFYGALRDFFDTLATEEQAACGWEGLDPIRYPSFGHKDDTYEDVVRPFYAMWNGFATKKTFSWKDLYRYSQAPDRKVRRLMEKENKRFRDEGIRRFNDAVRSLVAFVRKRDPRFKHNKQSESDRQKVLKDAAVAQAARSRAANQVKVSEEAVPEWMRASALEEGDVSDEEAKGRPAKGRPSKEESECVVCNKTFKSEKQYEAHERSKKHVRAVQQLRRQMSQEDLDLNLDEPSTMQEALNDAVGGPGRLSKEFEKDVERFDEPSEHDGTLEEPPRALEGSSECASRLSGEGHDQSDDSELEFASDEDYAPRIKVEQRLFNQHEDAKDEIPAKGNQINNLSERLAEESLNDESESLKKPKMGKAKEKRAKKAAQNSSASALSLAGLQAEFKCAACQAGFSSKTRLFSHIKDLGHAQHISKPVKGCKGKRG